MIGTPFPGFEAVPPHAQAGLIVVHGIAEHGARYRHAAEALARRHIASFVYDQRGHGMNPGTRTHIGNFADFAADLNLIGESVRQRLPGLPLFDHAALAGGTRGSGPGLPDQRFTHPDRLLGFAGQAARDLP